MARPKKQNQVLALEKGIKQRLYAAVTELHKKNQKPDLFNGFSKTYKKKKEEDEDYPPESKRVSVSAVEQLREFAEANSELFDIVAQKDWTNTKARGTVEVDGQELVTEAPATFLLFLEKQLNDFKTFVEAIPVLDPNESWNYDKGTGLYFADARETEKTKKVQEVLTLAQATEKHPAQAQMITVDKVVGYWTTIKQSGALPSPVKDKLLRRTRDLIRAVKIAREQANETVASDVLAGGAIFEFLLEPLGQ